MDLEKTLLKMIENLIDKKRELEKRVRELEADLDGFYT